jgi:hypothetical protein
MTTYESDIKTISSGEEVVFGLLSDMNNLSKLKENHELSDKIKDFKFDTDSCSFNMDMVGKVGFRIVEREPFKTIKFAAENFPVVANMWIQLKQVAENDTKMKLTLKAEIPTMLKFAVDKSLKEGINKIADALVKALESKD